MLNVIGKKFVILRKILATQRKESFSLAASPVNDAPQNYFTNFYEIIMATESRISMTLNILFENLKSPVLSTVAVQEIVNYRENERSVKWTIPGSKI